MRRPFPTRFALARTCAGLVPLGLLFLLVTSCARRPPRTARPRPPLPPLTVTTAEPASAEAPPGVTNVAHTEGRPSQLSDSERKAAARAAFAEGVELQEQKDCARALPRFEVAERLYEAPTHLLHIAQCQVATGRLVDAQETYATLEHLPLNAHAPAAFREAQSAGRGELARLKPRVPTLRLETNPPASSLKNLVVQINGTHLPADLVGIARPINPGRYHVAMTASPGRSGTGDVEIREGETKTLEVRFAR